MKILEDSRWFLVHWLLVHWLLSLLSCSRWGSEGDKAGKQRNPHGNPGGFKT